MPTIEITAEQAAALGRGENVTLVPERKPSTYVVINIRLGNVLELLVDESTNCALAYRRLVSGEVHRHRGLLTSREWEATPGFYEMSTDFASYAGRSQHRIVARTPERTNASAILARLGL